MADTYHLIVTNQSSMPGQIVVYQKPPDVLSAGVYSLAWFAEGAHQGTNASFEWTIDYNFIWSKVEKVAPGVICNATEVQDAELKQNNSITLDKNEYGYYFKDKKTDAKHAGSLIIEETGLIPANGAAVGIGMSGSGTFVWPTQPNIAINIAPHPEYWIAFGNYQKQEILDVQQMTYPKKISYGTNKYTATVTLKDDNTWSDIIYS